MKVLLTIIVILIFSLSFNLFEGNYYKHNELSKEHDKERKFFMNAIAINILLLWVFAFITLMVLIWSF